MVLEGLEKTDKVKVPAGTFAKMLIHRTQEAPTGRAAFQTVLGIGSHIRGPTYKELTAPELNG